MQLDLFTHARPAGSVHAFPLHRRADLVRSTADVLDSRSYKAGQRYWTNHVREQRQALSAAGLDQSSIDVEINRYATAISRILHLHEQSRRRPDDAA